MVDVDVGAVAGAVLGSKGEGEIRLKNFVMRC